MKIKRVAIQGAKPVDSLSGACPWIVSQLMIPINTLISSVTSKIAGAFTPRGRGGRQRLFEVYLLGMRLEIFLSKKQRQNHTSKTISNKVSTTLLSAWDSPSQSEFSFVPDVKFVEKYLTHSELPGYGVSEGVQGSSEDRIRKSLAKEGYE